MKEVTIYNITESCLEYKGQRDWVFERCHPNNFRKLQEFPDGEVGLSNVTRETVPVHYLCKFKETRVRGQYERTKENYVVISPELYDVLDEIIGESYRKESDSQQAANYRLRKTIDNFNYLPWWKRVKYLFNNL